MKELTKIILQSILGILITIGFISLAIWKFAI